MSGGPVKVQGPERQQATFDNLAEFVGCGATKGAAKIDCLRAAPYEKIYEQLQTVNLVLGYRSLASTWTLRPDGKLLTESPDVLVDQGKIADVPVIIGDMKE